MPSRELLDRFPVLDELYSPFIAAIRKGDVSAFDVALEKAERRLVELNLRTPHAHEPSAQPSDDRLAQLEIGLAAAKEDVSTLRVAAAAVRTRAETAERENDLLRQANTSLRESNEFLEKRLREVSI